MPYTDRFIATDVLIIHLSTIVPTIPDPALQSNYAGFLSVSAVTVFELAIKDIFFSFANRKNKVFGNFIDKHFEKINGRIKLDNLKKEHLPRFGDKYLERFKRKLDKKNNELFNFRRVNINSQYGNLITCRHNYVHVGSPTLTFNEVINSYQDGKEIIHCLDATMRY